MTPNEVSSFYDDRVNSQVRIGINLRHRMIFRFLKQHGLKGSDSVLEIGCGVGPVTSLVAKSVNKGLITAVDISPKSIAQAKLNLSYYRNIEYIVSDMSDFKSERPFDVIILPDVLEHIPSESHPHLFRTLYSVLKERGFVLVHIPDPLYQDWVRKCRPDLLQIIDQSLHSDSLLRDAYQVGFYVERLTSHNIFHTVPDYQVIVFRKNLPLKAALPISKFLLYFRTVIAKFTS